LGLNPSPAVPPTYSWVGVVQNVNGGTHGFSPNFFFTRPPITGLSPDIFLFQSGVSGISGTGQLVLQFKDVSTSAFFTIASFGGAVADYSVAGLNYLGFSLGTAHVLAAGSTLPDGTTLQKDTWVYPYTIGNVSKLYNAVFTASFNYSGANLNYPDYGLTGTSLRVSWSQ
jgi:hypothetical protein